ncbi:ribulose-phosphate 3-epimerase [Adhaeretor mobilis]|uniref:Ribulose-phosphate 3-epimerase n=1 Tax=Adhaeretor mobilis TaxID=1930276 RepID=A0A517MRE7_9BACT|nr:ribulose-phosphate 3-epimerase [Adhaeretor mobilis]QDS97454.1 Ribulose-phosphate 3-epimerase [Adhaeretor mobilis]
MPRECLAKLRSGTPAIMPSMLLCDFANLGAEVRAMEDAGARGLHLDVMDGQFVDNFTYGMTIVRAVRSVTNLPLDIHLMMVEPEKYLGDFADAGADILTIHTEAVEDPKPLLKAIRERNVGAGLALNPTTPLEQIADALPLCDLVLAMSVHPGAGGQSFNPVALEKLSSLKDQVAKEVLLEVDGGVNNTTAAACGLAGAHLLVVGSAIFRHDPSEYRAKLEELTQLAASKLAASNL